MTPRALHTAALKASPGEALGGTQLHEAAQTSAPLLALVDPTGAFRGLVDRVALLARALAQAAAEPG